MINPILFQLTMFTYLLSTILYFLYIGMKKEGLGKVASWTGLLGLAINTASRVVRYVESHKLGIGYVPLSNMGREPSIPIARTWIGQAMSVTSAMSYDVPR